jgi:hypothetical protein
MKKFQRLLLLAIIPILINSCLNYEQITTIKTDNSGEMFIHYFTNLNSWQDTLILSNIGLFNKDSLKSQFTNNYSKIERIEVFEDFSDSTIHSQIEIVFSNFDSLKQTKIFKNAEFSIKDGPDETKIFSQFILPFVTGFGFDLKDHFLSYTYYLPGKIMSHNATEQSNNKLVWKYSLEEVGKGKTITATYRPFRLKETPNWIYFLALLVVLVVIIYLFKKKKA